MQTLHNRRSFLGSLSSAGAASLLGRGESFAQDAPPEITTIRLAKHSGICIAPQYIADDLLRAEGFTDIQYVWRPPGVLSPAIGGNEVDFSMHLLGSPCRLGSFFWTPVSMNIEKRCNHYRLIVACMLSGASQDRSVIVGWSTAPRGQVNKESLGQLPKKLAAGPRVLART